jgi:hypothetical protein
VIALRALLPRGRALVLVDLGLALWVAVWIALGTAIAGQVHGLRQLSVTVTKVGGALQETGQTLDGLSSAPLIGGRIGDAAKRIDEAGDSTVASGARSRESIANLSWMLGVFLAVIPSVPVLVLYVPLRVAAWRERRALERLVRERGDDEVLRRLLAQRALLTIPYQRLLADIEDPLGAAGDARVDALADAELERLGVVVRPRRSAVR